MVEWFCPLIQNNYLNITTFVCTFCNHPLYIFLYSMRSCHWSAQRFSQVVGSCTRGSLKISLQVVYILRYLFVTLTKTVQIQFCDCRLTCQHSPHRSWGICNIVEQAFHFRLDSSLCPTITTSMSHLSLCHLHFEICGHQGDPLEQERGDSCLVPDQDCTLDVPRFPTRSTAGVFESHWHFVAKHCHAEKKYRLSTALAVFAWWEF